MNEWMNERLREQNLRQQNNNYKVIENIRKKETSCRNIWNNIDLYDLVGYFFNIGNTGGRLR
jgi:NAD-dependent SIR2 family protein deacetylase